MIDQIPDVQKQQAMDNFSAMRTALASGMIDGYVSERPEGVTATSVNKDLEMLEFSGADGFQTNPEDVQISVGMRKGDPDIQKVNQILSGISNDERTKIMDQAVKDQPAATDSEEKPGIISDFTTIWKQYGNMFLRGAGLTLFIALIGTVVGTTLGLLIGVFRSVPESGNALTRFFKNRKCTSFYLCRSIPRNTDDGTSNGHLLRSGTRFWHFIEPNDCRFVYCLSQYWSLHDRDRSWGIFAVDEGQFELRKPLV